MSYILVSVLDRISGIYSAPVALINKGSAIRWFTQSMKSQDQKFDPKDFDLYELGSFDSESGKIVGKDPVFILHGSEVVD